MCQMLRLPVLYYMLRVVPKDATPPWLNSGKVTEDETRPLPLFSTMIFRKPSIEGGFYYCNGVVSFGKAE